MAFNRLPDADIEPEEERDEVTSPSQDKYSKEHWEPIAYRILHWMRIHEGDRDGVLELVMHFVEPPIHREVLPVGVEEAMKHVEGEVFYHA